VLLSSVVATSDLLKARSAKSALDGVWRVTSFVRKADTADVGSDPSRWRQLRIWGNSIAIRRESDSIVQCQAATPSVDSMTLKCGQDQRGELRLTRTGDVVQIAGTVEGAQITASAQRVGLSEYRLMRSRFRWMIG
jgi:hypothetical protein